MAANERQEAERERREGLIAGGQKRVDEQRAAEKIRMLAVEVQAAEKRKDRALRAHRIAVAQKTAGVAQNPGDTDAEKRERQRVVFAKNKTERAWKYAGFVAEMAKKRLERIQNSRENEFVQNTQEETSEKFEIVKEALKGAVTLEKDKITKPICRE
ncbi:MAG: uncharacterized protein A8A55_2893, partial [Amphiamblys sp. WSBS2006]